MKFLNYVILSLALLFSVNSFAVEHQYHQNIASIIAAFKADDKAAVASLVSYPLARAYPVPAINNEAELIERFEQVFDPQLIAQIAGSDIDTDWDKVGWRGIMLNSGVVWVDTEGKIVGLKYQTDKEPQPAKRLIAADTIESHPSINTFVAHDLGWQDRKSTRLNSSHPSRSRMPSSA